jgi:hypothetical protein
VDQIWTPINASVAQLVSWVREMKKKSAIYDQNGQLCFPNFGFNSYHKQREQYYKLRPCAILWLDILGFKRLLEQVEDRIPFAINKLCKLENILEKYVFGSFFPWRTDSQLFSDTIVMTFPFPANGLGNLSKDATKNYVYYLPFWIGKLQCEFIRNGFLVRGVVASGRWLNSRRL